MSQNPRVLRIQNSLVGRVLAVAGPEAISTTALTNRRSGKEFAAEAEAGASPAREFSLKWRGRWLHGRPDARSPAQFLFQRSSHVSESHDSRTVEACLLTPDGTLEVELRYQSHEDHPAIRKWMTVTNRGATPGRLSAVVWEDVAIAPAPVPGLRIVGRCDGDGAGASWSGRPGDSIALVFDPAGREGYAVISEAPGPTSSVEINPGGRPRLRVSLSSAFGGVMLQPGESFSTPAASIVLFDERDPDNAASAAVHEFLRRVIGRRRGFQSLVAYSASGPEAPSDDTRWIDSKAFTAVAAGLPTVIVEENGWRGDVQACAEEPAPPPALLTAASALRSRQLGFGIAMSLATLDPKWGLARKHPEWLCRNDDGSFVLVRGRRGEKRVLACLASSYGEYLLRQVDALCQASGVEFIQFTGPAIAALLSGGPALCHAESHNHQGANDVALAVGRALQFLCAELKGRFPSLILGFDHDVWPTAAAIDAGLFQGADFLRTSALPDERGRPTPREARALFYRRAILCPPEWLSPGLLAIDGPNPLASVATMMAGYPILHGRIERVAAGQIDWLRAILDWRATLAREVDFSERFYLLHGSASTQSGQWDGYARLSRGGEGFAAVFRNGSLQDTQVFGIPGVEAAARYRLDSPIRDRAYGVFAGRELAKGFTFQTPLEDGADVVQIRRA